MRRILIVIAAAAFVLAAVHVATSNQPATETEEEHVLDVLVGRTIGLQPTADRYSVVVDARWKLEMMFTVLDVDDNILVLENQARTDTIYLPISSIREIAVSKTGVRS